MTLTVNQIKEAVERFNPDGFRIKHNLTEFLYYNGSIVSDLFDNICHHSGLYDLFLDRVIQAYNRQNDRKYDIIQDVTDIQIIFPDVKKCLLLQHNGTTEGIREAREKATVFVLKELRK